ncbi:MULTISPECIES: ABC transporter substrate-binding protein [Pontibacillus]|uniref:ABC transporter substrate-binding protein n=1 Tax=Pontibacillus chungwhensis TaxID=265426 RepID=A0ABY8V3F1_9BACI|nr:MULTISPECIES: ABC transporter substrate-binding protein [Pontibacillus]MCD5322247.1 ABC transporter substrate-binding protein [Pontibacillus sp. HN14]WIF99541.1 ABC transporter substrate-binding protein [Pontibacillus chungwhensis]
MKKSWSLLLALMLGVGLLAGCSDSGSASSDKDDDVLKVWSFTDELKEPIKTFEEKNGVKVELTIVPIADYPTKLKPVLESGVGAPDVFTGEVAFLKQWTDRDYWENLSQEPYNADEWEGDYIDYVYDLGKDSEGNVKALSWQTTPGGIFYKRSIAKEVLGTDDPDQLGEMMSSWDGLFEVGEQLKEEGYRLFPDEGAIRWFAKGEDPQPWVNEDNELIMTDAKLNYFDHAKKLREKDYTAFAPEWSPSWNASMSGPIAYNGGWEEVDENASDKTEVFSYALPTWGLHSVLKPNAEGTEGDWGVTTGPVPYFWGGTWIGIYSGSEKKDLAWDFVQMMTHDEEFLTDWAKETGDVLSYKPVNEKIKDDFSEPFLNGQNNYTFFLEQAKKIEPGVVTKYDQQLDTLLGGQVIEYVDDKKSKEEALEEFYKQVKNAYPDIKTP